MLSVLSSNDILNAALAVLPIILMLVALLWLRLPIHLAACLAFVAALILALFRWGMSAGGLAGSLAEGIFLAFCPVIWVIFAALFTYNLSVKNGAMDTLRRLLTGISDDMRVQTLIIVFAFGGFLEATAGFGTAVAIPAGILVILGFEPLFAAVICLVSNTVSVAFGVVGVPIITLANVTNIPVETLSAAAAIQLLPLSIVLPCVLVGMVGGGLKGAGETLKYALFSGAAFGVTQTFVAVFVGAELAAIAGSLMSLLTLVVCCRLFPVKNVMRNGKQNQSTVDKTPITYKDALRSAGGYIFLLALVLCAAIPGLKFLKQGAFLFTHTFYPEGAPQSFAFLTNPGTLFLLAGLAGALLYRVKLSVIIKTAAETVKQMRLSSLTIILVLCIARVMYHAGMVESIAALLSATGAFFPTISPLLGAFGTFITGSDTSSNVLFGALQKQTATQTGGNVVWLVAGNASGATTGKMLSLQSIAVASSSIRLKGEEGKILKSTVKYAALMALALSIIVFVGNKIYPTF